MAEAAAKEPSMEDILSSIRKIIADEKPEAEAEGASQVEAVATGPAPVQATSSAAEQAVKPSVTAEKSANAPISQQPESVTSMSEHEYSATESGRIARPQPAADDQRSSAIGAAGQKPDIVTAVKSKVHEDRVIEAQAAARAVRPAPAEAGHSAVSALRAEVSQPRQPSPVQAQASMQEHAAASAGQARQMQMAADARQAPSPVQARYAEAQEGSAALQVEQPQIQSQQLAPAAASEEEAAFKGALMSPSSNEAVSDSFERLKRSASDDLDAKTEAILRPMLREWLDENLPNLVERLVREEIERVARG